MLLVGGRSYAGGRARPRLPSAAHIRVLLGGEHDPLQPVGRTHCAAPASAPVFPAGSQTRLASIAPTAPIDAARPTAYSAGSTSEESTVCQPVPCSYPKAELSHPQRTMWAAPWAPTSSAPVRGHAAVARRLRGRFPGLRVTPAAARKLCFDVSAFCSLGRLRPQLSERRPRAATKPSRSPRSGRGPPRPSRRTGPLPPVR
jgi:hypothetical protein